MPEGVADVSSGPVFDYAGGIHFHSSYSYDARAPLPEIVASAVNAGLHFAILTDHYRLDAKGGYSGKTLLIIGEEISPRYNHYLALGITRPVVVWKSESNPQKYIDEVAAQGGFGFISHPDHAGAPLFGSRAYPWIQWDVTGYSGLGIWDLMSDWANALGSPWRAIRACLKPIKALQGPTPKTLARWDELTQKGHCVAIGELDNHAHRRSFFGLKRVIFPFDFAFRTIRTHVLLEKELTGKAEEDEHTILQALKQGQSYISLDYWHNASGFMFRAYDEHTQVLPGGTFTRNGQALIEARLPGEGKISLVRDGRVVREESRRALQWDLTIPGVYRIEALQYAEGKWRPWIYSNPIWVK